MSATPDFASTLTSGIQEISAFLPLLGTAECEEHIGSALFRGYLYAAASPLSVFGTLGIVKAGVKALVTSLSFPQWGIFGAKKLDDAGFIPSGKCLSLIMIDPDHPKRYLAETRFEKMLKKAQIETLRVNDLARLRIVTSSATWNGKLILVTALSSLAGLAPYVFLNVHHGPHPLSSSLRWAFPITRVSGSFLIATTVQFLIEQRVFAILKHRVVFHALANEGYKDLQSQPWWNPGSSSESSILELRRYINRSSSSYNICDFFKNLCRTKNGILDQERDTATSHPDPSKARLEKDFEHVDTLFLSQNTRLMHLLLCVAIALGIVGSVVGYVGCFSIVQATGPSDSFAPIIWLLLEGFLSVLRMVLWGWNPEKDDSEPIRILMDADSNPPFPTCDVSAEEILSTKILPLTPAPEFLRSIRSYIGYLPSLDFGDVSIYYTLTRRSAVEPGLNQLVLFVTVVDHRDRITAVYYRDSEGYPRYFSATPPDDPTSVVIQVEIEETILGLDHIPAMNRFQGQLDPFKTHYRDIVQALQTRQESKYKFVYEFQMNWKLSDASTSQPSMKKIEKLPSVDTSPNHEPETYVSEYLILGALRRKRKDKLGAKRAWIETYMPGVASLMQIQIEQWASLLKSLWKQQASNATVLPMTKQIVFIRDSHLLLEFFELELLYLLEFQAWENQLLEKCERLLKSLLSQGASLTSDVLVRQVIQRWKWLALDRFKTDQMAAASRVAGVRQVIYESDRLNEMWCTLEIALQEDWQNFSEDLKNLRKYALPQCLSDTLSRYHRPKEFWTLLQPPCQALWQFWVNQRVQRLQFEHENLKGTIRALALADVDLIIPGISHADLVFSQAKWISLVESSIVKGDIPNLVSSLKRNSNLSFIQLDGSWNDTVLADLVSNLVQNRPHALATIIIDDIQPQKYSETISRLSDMKRDRPGITWTILSGLSGRENDTILLNLESSPVIESNSNTSADRLPGSFFHFQGFRIDQEMKTLRKFREKSKVEAKVFGPGDHSFLLIMFDHANLNSEYNTPMVSSNVGIDIYINSRLQHSFVLHPGPKKRDLIQLPFQSSSSVWNLISITVTGKAEYELHDIELVDPNAFPYHGEYDTDRQTFPTTEANNRTTEPGTSGLNSFIQQIHNSEFESTLGITSSPFRSSSPFHDFRIRWDGRAGSVPQSPYYLDLAPEQESGTPWFPSARRTWTSLASYQQPMRGHHNDMLPPITSTQETLSGSYPRSQLPTFVMHSHIQSPRSGPWLAEQIPSPSQWYPYADLPSQSYDSHYSHTFRPSPDFNKPYLTSSTKVFNALPGIRNQVLYPPSSIVPYYWQPFAPPSKVRFKDQDEFIIPANKPENSYIPRDSDRPSSLSKSSSSSRPIEEPATGQLLHLEDKPLSPSSSPRMSSAQESREISSPNSHTPSSIAIVDVERSSFVSSSSSRSTVSVNSTPASFVLQLENTFELFIPPLPDPQLPPADSVLFSGHGEEEGSMNSLPSPELTARKMTASSELDAPPSNHRHFSRGSDFLWQRSRDLE